MLEGIRLETKEKVRKLVIVMRAKMVAEVVLRNGHLGCMKRAEEEIF